MSRHKARCNGKTNSRPYIPLAAYRYKVLKNAVYERDKGKCQQCGRDTRFAPVKPGGQHKFEIHHIQPRCLGGKSEFFNLCVLCCECHRKTTAEMHAELAHERQWNPNYKNYDQRTTAGANPHNPSNLRTDSVDNCKPRNKMSFEISTATKPKHPPIPEGLYHAVLAEFVDLGEVQDKFDDFPHHKLKIVFQLKAVRDDGKRHELRSWNEKVSMHERSNLRKKYLDKILGQRAVEKLMEEPTFNLSSLVGTNCMIDVVHNSTGEYPNIGTILAYRDDAPIQVSADYVPLQKREGYEAPKNYSEREEAYAPNPSDPLPPTNRPVTPNPAPPMPTEPPVDVDAMKGNGKVESAKTHKAVVTAMAAPAAPPPALSRAQMKVISDGIKQEAMKYDVELDKVDYDNFEEWRTASQNAIDEKGAGVFD